jgi:hypothetical protein
LVGRPNVASLRVNQAKTTLEGDLEQMCSSVFFVGVHLGCISTCIIEQIWFVLYYDIRTIFGFRTLSKQCKGVYIYIYIS